jgi:hypothetical protein
MISDSSFRKTFELLGTDLPQKHPLLHSRYDIKRRCRFEQLASELLEHFTTERERTRLVVKLRNAPQFETTISEVETWSYFRNRGFRVDAEPFGEKGPDFRVSRDGLTVIVEVCSLGREAAEKRLSAIFLDIGKRTRDLRSRYRIDINIREENCREAKFVSEAVRATKRALATVESSGSNSALFCYVGSGDHFLLDRVANIEEMTPSGPTHQGRPWEEIHRCAFVVQFRKSSIEPKNLITISAKDGALWSKSVGRLRSTLNEKRGKQLSRTDRNIIVVDHADCVDLDGTDVLDALYGRSYVRVDVETLTERGSGRRPDGFFKNTERVQAVALIGRADLTGACAWTVFPTHNSRASRRFTLREFELLGGLRPELSHLASP